MTKKATLYNIYNDLCTALTPVVGKKNVFLQDRPSHQEGEVPPNKFAVIELPVSIRDTVIGNQNTMLSTSGVIYLFVLSRNNKTLDVNAAGDLVDAVVSLFPISGQYSVATNPDVRLMGTDGGNHQVIMVTFDLRTRWRAFDE